MKELICAMAIFASPYACADVGKLTQAELKEAKNMCRLYKPQTPEWKKCLASRVELLLYLREVEARGRKGL